MSDDRCPALGMSFLGRRLPAGIDVRVVTIRPGDSQRFDPADWRDALVVVERGQIVLESVTGRRLACQQGFVGCLADLPLSALHNEGHDVALISAVSRTATSRSAPDRLGVISFSGGHRRNEGHPTTQGDIS